jgi:hypothetical protein
LNNRFFKPLFNVALALTVTLVLVACGQSTSQDETVEERAQARWDHFADRDFAAAWEYYTPAFRQMTAREDFALDMRNRPLRWHAAEVRSAECDEDRCKVTVSVTYQPTGASGPHSQMRMTRDIEEQWIRLDGRWWFVPN